MPTAQVWRGNDKTMPIPRQEKDISQIEFTQSNEGSQTIEAFLDDTYTDGFLVMADGYICLLYTSPSPRDKRQSRMPSSA